MKNVRVVLLAVLGLGTFTTVLRADPDDADTAVRVDADGVPVSLSKPQAVRLSPDEVAEIRKKQARAVLDRDWLVRDYEKQLKMNAQDGAAGNNSANLYYQLSSNKDLAKLAGLPDIDDGTDDGTSPSRQESARSAPDSTYSHSIAPSAPTHSILATGSYLKPFITPLTSPTGEQLSGFYSSGPAAGVSPSNASAAPKASTLNASENPASAEDSSDLETPGMVAADKNGNPDSIHLSLDVLPGESIEHARDHQDNDQLLTLPLPMSADQLHRQEASAVGPPNPFGQAQSLTTSQTPKPIPVNDADAPIPASKTPVVNPVRAPIANPYDILNR